MSAPSSLVLMVAYNERPYMGEQLSSVLNQSNVDISVLIGDDCSTDGWQYKFDDLLKRENLSVDSFESSLGGPSRNFIRILKIAYISNFYYIAFSDRDDIWAWIKYLRR